MKHIFIVNPAAGKSDRTAEYRKMIEAAFAPRGLSYELLVSGAPGECRTLARQAAQSGEEVRLYACGGDGTANEVANGILGFDNAAMTMVPVGTGNDLLKNFGDDLEKFRDVENLWDGPVFPMDVIEVNGRYALTIACSGIDARVAADVHKYSESPLLDGKSSYIVSLLVNFFFKGIGSHWKVEMDGEEMEGDWSLVSVCNGRYYGGGFMPVPDAMPDDGVLDVLAVGEISRLTFFRLVGKYAQGLYRQYPQLITDWHGQSLSFSSPREITVVVDGEVMRGTRFTVRLSPLKINFFFPAGADYSPEF